MNGNSPTTEFLLKIQLRHARDLGRAAHCDAPLGEQADGQVNQRLVFRQFQTAQSLVLHFDLHARQRSSREREQQGNEPRKTENPIPVVPPTMRTDLPLSATAAM